MQPALFSTSPPFGGETYDPALDQHRLQKQLGRVWSAMRSGKWMTLDDIARVTKDPHASVSARLRDLRKPAFGGYDVQRRRRGTPESGLFEYRMLMEGR
jgi:hypothetical protein